MSERSPFRRPLGLALAGGASLGSWQTGAVHELTHKLGVHFDAVLGFSAGALNATGYFLDRLQETHDRWLALERAKLLRFSPRIFPPTLFSGAPLLEQIQAARDEEHAKANGRGRLVIVSTSRTERRRIYAVFDHKQEGRWDGSLVEHLAASCSIPMIFPPVTTRYQGRPHTLVDGGVSIAERFSFKELAHCKDILVVEMVRPEEMGRPIPRFAIKSDQEGRETSRRLMDEGIASLKDLKDGPRVFRLMPSRELEFGMLSFKSRHMEEALHRGAEDARAFIAGLRRAL
jgi:predicted acylesterase/phospholipase RssA